MGAATFRFYAELNDFLPVGDRQRDVVRTFLGGPSVKDQIEACGVPHTEVDLILVNGCSVGFDHRLGDGDRVSVYPVFEALDVTMVVHLRPRPLREPRFVLDVHLGKLARRLRRAVYALPDLQRAARRRPERGGPRAAPARNPASSRRLPHLSVLPTGLLVGAALPTASGDRRGGPALREVWWLTRARCPSVSAPALRWRFLRITLMSRTL
jgi:hypothetical protein